MGIRTRLVKRDDRVERLNADPNKYFAEAYARARTEVQDEIKRERRSRRRRPAAA